MRAYDPATGEISVVHRETGGTNGLTFGPDGWLYGCAGTARQVVRWGADGNREILAERFEGNRLNSPNDLVVDTQGRVWFTDPRYGDDHADRELDHDSVYRLTPPAGGDGAWSIERMTFDTTRPNGILLSADERTLYVANWDDHKKVVMQWDVRPDGTIANGRAFADLTGEPGEEALDGMKVDHAGNVFVSGPGGLWVFAPDGRRLGTIRLPELAANFAWGDGDGKGLYLTARTGLYRIRLTTPGIRPPLAPPTN